MEDEKSSEKSPKPIISRARIDRSSTYNPGKMNVSSLGSKRKKVMFTDRAQNGPLCTVFNYEPVEFVEDDDGDASPKSTSCACLLF